MSAERDGKKKKETTYLHFVLNQRTLPLGVSFPECGARRDGWCEMDTFLKLMETKTKEAKFEESCFGDWELGPLGSVVDGIPV